MPWMIEVFNRKTGGWQRSYHFSEDEGATRDEAQRLSQSDKEFSYFNSWYDDRPYEQRIITRHPAAPEDWGYRDHHRQ